MKTTRYFSDQVLRKRLYLSLALCELVVDRPLRTIVQDDGRIRCWGAVRLPGESRKRILRVVLLEDGETIHNAFLDRNFKRDDP